MVGIIETEESIAQNEGESSEDEEDLDHEYELSNERMEVDMIIDMMMSPIKELDENKCFYDCI